MTDAQLFTLWTQSLMVIGVLVLVAAGLLIGIWLAARRILRLALAALGLVEQIKENTASVWAIGATNETATRILSAAESIRDHGALVATALHEAGEKSDVA